MSRYGILSSVRDRYFWHEIPRDRDLPNPIPNSGSGFTEPDPEFRIGIYRTVISGSGSGFYRTGKFGIGIYRTGKFGIGIYRIGPLAIFGPGETSRERLL